MKKNTASQIIGAQLVNATTGAAFTGSVVAYVTGDGGTQAAGSVGSGACTHEGNGFHTYAPAQAETNYDHVAVTFIGTGAVPATVQVYTSTPQTGDAFARLGAPAGASVSADVAAVKTQTAAIETDTQDIQARLPAALVSGRIDASVGAMASAVLTATAIAADAITDAKVASDVTIASVTGSVGSVAGAVGSVTGAVGSVTGNVGGNVTGSVGSVVGLTASNLDAAISTRAAASDLATVAGYIDTEVAAIKITTDRLGTTLESGAGSPGEFRFSADALVNAPASSGGGGAPSAAAIADAVWDEILSGHAISGSAGEALSASGGAGDPWITALPGSYSAGQAGYIVGQNLNATVSSRATQTSVDTIDTNVDAVLVDTAEIGAAGAGLTALASAANLATLSGYVDTEVASILAAVDTEVAAIKAKTDNLPAAPAAVGDIPTATENADALLNRDMATGTDSGSPTVRTVRQALRFLRNKWSISGTTLTVTKEDDATASWTSTVSTTAGADPVTGNDPA